MQGVRSEIVGNLFGFVILHHAPDSWVLAISRFLKFVYYFVKKPPLFEILENSREPWIIGKIYMSESCRLKRLV